MIRRGEGGDGRLGGPLWSPVSADFRLPNHIVGKQKEKQGRRATIKALPAPPSHPRPYGCRWAFREVDAYWGR